ncbi:uncharacterized protein LOC143302906 [Bombus vancouverensis nearcticus]|uniref:uncharacterized protein LOC143302906 n=1 Tax=Bombus vancouverensis nearcticus TaxID=2705178 RepID=UPI00402B1087
MMLPKPGIWKTISTSIFFSKVEPIFEGSHHPNYFLAGERNLIPRWKFPSESLALTGPLLAARRNECPGACGIVTSPDGREPINWIPRSSTRIYCIVVEARKGPRSSRRTRGSY